MGQYTKNKMFENKNILVTGGTGSFGRFFIKTLLKNYNPNKMIVFSRDELKQYEMQCDPELSLYHSKDKIRYFIYQMFSFFNI